MQQLKARQKSKRLCNIAHLEAVHWERFTFDHRQWKDTPLAGMAETILVVNMANHFISWPELLMLLAFRNSHWQSSKEHGQHWLMQHSNLSTFLWLSEKIRKTMDPFLFLCLWQFGNHHTRQIHGAVLYVVLPALCWFIFWCSLRSK